MAREGTAWRCRRRQCAEGLCSWPHLLLLLLLQEALLGLPHHLNELILRAGGRGRGCRRCRRRCCRHCALGLGCWGSRGRQTRCCSCSSSCCCCCSLGLGRRGRGGRQSWSWRSRSRGRSEGRRRSLSSRGWGLLLRSQAPLELAVPHHKAEELRAALAPWEALAGACIIEGLKHLCHITACWACWGQLSHCHICCCRRCSSCCCCATATATATATAATASSCSAPAASSRARHRGR